MKSSKIKSSFTLILRTSLMRKTSAYPTKKIIKKRRSAKEADAEFKVNIILATVSCANGCLGWTGLANFFRAPSTTPFTKTVTPSDTVCCRLYNGDGMAITYCMLHELSQVQSDLRRNGRKYRHPTKTAPTPSIFAPRLLYFCAVVAAQDSSKISSTWGTINLRDGSWRLSPKTPTCKIS